MTVASKPESTAPATSCGVARRRRRLAAIVLGVSVIAGSSTMTSATGPDHDDAAVNGSAGHAQLQTARRIATPTTAPRVTAPPASAPRTTPLPTSAPRTTAPPTKQPPILLSVQLQGVLDRTNAERAGQGLAPLTLQPQLSGAAHAHAANQFNKSCGGGGLSHTGTDGSNVADRVDRTGYKWSTVGENIACGYGTAEMVMSGWMKSEGHRRNILNPSYTEIGLSFTFDSNGRPYWVQVFGRP